MNRHEAKTLCVKLHNQLTGTNGSYMLRDKGLRKIAFSKVEELMEKYAIHHSELEEKTDMLIFK